MAGMPAAPGASSPSPRGMLQRQVAEGVVSNPLPDPRQAKVCMIHLHGDEENGRQVATSLRGSHCANFVDLSSRQRAIHVRTSSGVCEADPNRIFTATGIDHHALTSCPASATAEAKRELVNFRDNQLIPAISQCRQNGGGLFGGLPMVAFHNNSGGGFSAATVAAPSARDTTRTGGATNPSSVPGQRPGDFILTTDPQDFSALRTTRNTLLQSNAIAAGSSDDDGSLSVALQSERYVNIEAEGKRFTGRSGVAFVNEMNMALDVFASIGVPRQPCPPPPSPSPSPSPSNQQSNTHPEAPAQKSTTPEAPK
jgi:hypothetical protein